MNEYEYLEKLLDSKMEGVGIKLDSIADIFRRVTDEMKLEVKKIEDRFQNQVCQDKEEQEQMRATIEGLHNRMAVLERVASEVQTRLQAVENPTPSPLKTEFKAEAIKWLVRGAYIALGWGLLALIGNGSVERVIKALIGG